MDLPLRTRVATVLAPVLTVILVAGACGPTTQSASPQPSASASPTTSPDASASPSGTPTSSASPDTNAVLDEIETQVSAIRGLTSTAGLEREVIDEPRLLELVTEHFDEDSPPAYVAANERLYKALGLLPEDLDLRKATLDMLGSGVAGFYRPDQKKMYVVSRTDALTPADRVTYSHEFTHALQDEQWPVFTEQDGVLDDSDWLLARQAVYEGDATLAMTYWLQANLSPEQIADATAPDPESQAVIDALPAILSETLLYPYTTGAFFVLNEQATGGWAAVDAMYDRLPASTEQILHPEAYAANEAPIDVQMVPGLAGDLGAGWSVPLLDTFGEFQTGIWLREGGAEAPDEAAAGWGGDRVAIIEGPDGAWAIAWRTEWDSKADAAGFDTAATTALAKAGGVGQVLPGEGGTTRWVLVADKAKTLDHVAGVLGLAD